MSLIEEALRQVQETAPPPAPVSRPPVVLRSPVVAPLPPAHSQSDSNMPAAVIASLALVGLLSLAWMAGAWWRTRRLSPETTLAGQPTLSQSFERLSRPIRPLANTPAFLLSGIMDQGGEKVAVVNNTIVQAGDLVDGARVLEVRSDSVWLRWKNQDVILKTAR